MLDVSTSGVTVFSKTRRDTQLKCTVASLYESAMTLFFGNGVPQAMVTFSDVQIVKNVVMIYRLQHVHEVATGEYVSINTSIPTVTVPLNRCTGEVYRTVRATHENGLFADTSTFELNDATVGIRRWRRNR